nr:NAD(P)-binding domain-containing protein [Actinomycetota bacterium]
MSSEAAPVAIVGGTGALGFGLALRLAAAGTPIVIGSRGAERAKEAARRVGERLGGEAPVRGTINQDAVRDVPAVFLCVPFRNQSENLTNLKDALAPGQLLVDATVPLAASIGG